MHCWHQRKKKHIFTKINEIDVLKNFKYWICEGRTNISLQHMYRLWRWHSLIVVAENSQLYVRFLYFLDTKASFFLTLVNSPHIFPSISRRAKGVRRKRNSPKEPPLQTRPVWSPSSRLLHPASCPSGHLWLCSQLQCLIRDQQPVERQQSQRSLPAFSAWVTLSPHFSYKSGYFTT